MHANDGNRFSASGVVSRNQMIPDATTELRGTNGATAVEAQECTTTPSEPGTRKLFDAFETDFFQQGDDGANLPGELYLLDDADGSAGDKRALLSRSSLLGLTILSSGLALAACAALWRSNAPSAAPPNTVSSRTRTASLETTTKPSAVAPVPAARPTSAASAPVPTEPSTSDAVAQAAAEPVVPLAEEVATPGSVVEAAPAAAFAAPTPGTVAEAEPTRAVPPQDTDIGQRCRESIREKRNRRILALCPAAFASDGGDGHVAVALAKAEFNRGRFAQANLWSKRAIAINPDSAEAYVFAGGAEQNMGHRKAAKQAYLQYLRLAPSGRYAAELRSILGSL